MTTSSIKTTVKVIASVYSLVAVIVLLFLGYVWFFTQYNYRFGGTVLAVLIFAVTAFILFRRASWAPIYLLIISLLMSCRSIYTITHTQRGLVANLVILIWSIFMLTFFVRKDVRDYFKGSVV